MNNDLYIVLLLGLAIIYLYKKNNKLFGGAEHPSDEPPPPPPPRPPPRPRPPPPEDILRNLEEEKRRLEHKINVTRHHMELDRRTHDFMIKNDKNRNGIIEPGEVRQFV
jgi:hypothetical protein